MAIIHLKRTSLYDVHRAAGARIVEFGGWEMPVQYAGIVEEHHAVRTAAGLFDVSHMGEVEIFGPGAVESVKGLVTNDAGRLTPFHLAEGMEVAGLACLVARTGYTGENGFEIACEWDAAPVLWRALVDTGRPDGLVPAGLGARDTLRLEAGYMLYGNDIDETTTPLEAPLGWTVKFEKGEFIGREALLAQKERGAGRKLVGFEMMERAVPRHGYALLAGGRPPGQGTRGTLGPRGPQAIGTGYVRRGDAPVSVPLPGGMRGRRTGAKVVKLPFYRRG